MKTCIEYSKKIFVGKMPTPEEVKLLLSASPPFEIKKETPLETKMVVQIGEGEAIYGSLKEIIQLSEDRFLVLIKEGSGRIHAIDPTLPKIKFRDASKLGPFDLEVAQRLTRPSEAFLDTESLQKQYCKQMTGSKATPEAEKKLNSLLSKVNTTKMMKLLSKTCAATAGAHTIFQILVDDNIFDKDRGDYYSRHRSNLTWGLAGMTVFHNCLAGMAPAASKALLTTGLGLYISGNTFFELGYDGVDLNDFASGATGIILYGLYGRFLEKKLDVNFRKFCK